MRLSGLASGQSSTSPASGVALLACDPDGSGASFRDALVDGALPVAWYAGFDYAEQGSAVQMMIAVADGGITSIVSRTAPTAEITATTGPGTLVASLHPALYQALYGA